MNKKRKHRNIEKVTGLSNLQKKKDNFSQIFFLKINNGTNTREQNISLNPKKNLLDTAWKVLQSKTVTKHLICYNLNQNKIKKIR